MTNFKITFHGFDKNLKTFNFFEILSFVPRIEEYKILSVKYDLTQTARNNYDVLIEVEKVD